MLLDDVKKIKSTEKELKEFGWVVGGVALALGALLLWRHRPAYPYFLIAGTVLVFFGFVKPEVLKPVQRAWMTLALLIGWVMTRVLLGVLFYFVLTPISLISRLTGKEFLDMKIGRSGKSYWNYRKPRKFEKKIYEQQF